MEYVKDNWIGNPESTHYIWKLTEDERARLKEILAGFDSYCVNEFISNMEYLCQGVLIVSEKQGNYKRPSKQSRKINILDAIEDLKKAQKVARRIRNWNLSPYLPYNLFEQSQYDWGEALEDSHRLAIGVDKDISKLIEVLKKSPDLSPQQGNPGTIALSFAEQIADAYKKHIGWPTTTTSKTSISGHFHSVVEFAFEIVGLPSKDVSKVVNQAYKKGGRNPVKKE